jgi:hypothetical protein
VSKLRSLEFDDENDTYLFDRLQEYVLERYPNPDRIGCLDLETLKCFVECPQRLDLSDLKYLHIFRCAECTRRLMEFRRIWEARSRWVAPNASADLAGWRHFLHKVQLWIERVVATALPLKVSKRSLVPETKKEPNLEAAVSNALDMRRRPLVRANQEPACLPRMLVELQLRLSDDSPGGIHRVVVAEDEALQEVLIAGSAPMFSKDSCVELTVHLDLRDVLPGTYFLGVVRQHGEIVDILPLRIA